MKTLDELSRIGLDELETASVDEGVPVPEELARRVQAAVNGASETPRRGSAALRPSGYRYSAAVIAAAVAVIIGSFALMREPAPKDTFDDPYLAYAEVEKAFAKISRTVSMGADKVSETENVIEKIAYWK